MVVVFIYDVVYSKNVILFTPRGIKMTEKFKKEEQFLRVLADAYITHNADDLLSWLPDDFGYDSMWVCDSMKTKEQYKNYIIGKLETQERTLYNVEFAMMKDKRTGQPILLITNPVEDKNGPAAFVATSDNQGNIKRLDLVAAGLYPLEPISEDNVIKRTYKTILDSTSNCGVSFIKGDGTISKYKGVIVRGANIKSSWGLAYIDDIPDDFCMVYDYAPYATVGMFTKDTKISVDYVFVSDTGQVIKVHRNMPPLSTDTVRCEHVEFVLELKAGQCEKNHISVGDMMRINAENNSPLPVKCNDVVFEDDKMVVTKIWECPKYSIFSDTDDRKRLFFHNWDGKTYMNLAGNVLCTKKKKYTYEGDQSDDGIKPVHTGRRWLLVDKEDNETPVNINGILYLEDAGCGLFKMNTQMVNLAYHWDYDPGMYGYIDSKGNIIVKPQYIWADRFDEDDNLAIVCKGHWHTDPKWSSEDKEDACWSDEMLFGMIDRTGNEVVPCIYDEIRRLNDGWTDKYFAHFGGWEKGKWGIIDSKGNWVVKPKFNNYGYYAQGNLVDISSWTDKVKIYDIKKQRYLFKKTYEEIEFDEEAGWMIVTEFNKELGRDIAKIVDCNGNEKFPSKYSYIGKERNGHRLVWINGPDKKDIHKGRKYGFIDSNGKEIIPCVYDGIEQSYRDDEKMFAFKENGKWGIADFNGKVLMQPRYALIRLWEDWGLAYVKDEEHDKAAKGLITLDGKMVLPIKYANIYAEDDMHIMCHTNCKTEMFQLRLKNNV